MVDFKIVPHPNKWFMAKFDRYEPFIQDSTQMKELKQCDRKYFYRMILGFVPRVKMYQINLDWGNARHTFREILENTNGDVATAMEAAYKVKLTPPNPNSPEAKYEYLNKAALTKAMALDYQSYLREKELGRMVVIPGSVEQPLNVQMPDGSYTGGRVDQILQWNGIWDRDWKTSSKPLPEFAKEKDPDDQATRYIYMLSKLHGDLIRGVMFDVLYTNYTKKDGLKMELYEHLVSKTEKQLQMWEREQMHLNKQLLLNRDADIWPMRETKNCKYCEYAKVCRASNEPAQIAQLESNYIVQPWNHLNVKQKEGE